MAAKTRRKYVPGGFALKVKRSRSGLGLYAEQDIPKGACIIEYVGREISKEEQYTSNSRYLFEVNSRKTLDGTDRKNTARYINHSCVPNCEPEIHKARVFIFARKNIQAGEELAYDYGKEYFNDYLKDVCSCPKCTAKRVKD